MEYFSRIGMIQRLHDDWYVYENCERKRLNDVCSIES